MDGVAERHIQTTMNMLRSVIQQAANLDARDWDLALPHVTNLKQALPITSRHITSPHEFFTGEVPHVTHFRVFGCKALYKLDKTGIRTKMGATAMTAAYVGAHSRSRCKLVDCATGKLLLRRLKDVIFFEDEYPELRYRPHEDQFETIDIDQPIQIMPADADDSLSTYLNTRDQLLHLPTSDIDVDNITPNDDMDVTQEPTISDTTPQESVIRDMTQDAIDTTSNDAMDIEHEVRSFPVTNIFSLFVLYFLSFTTITMIT